MIREFGEWLWSRTNKHHRPFQPDTVSSYTETARVLDRWMTQQGIDCDFTACDTALLNRFFADYITTHGQGGTNTRQRNLRHLFTWLEDAYGHRHPYTESLHRHSPVQPRAHSL
jgi:site-specific recombinase XerD